jgi:dolichol-phosphate mannosyltransferase
MNVKQKILIFAPTLNEKNNIQLWVEDIAKLYSLCDLLIVDDNSNDGTIEIIETMQQKFSNLKLHVRPEQLGIGSAHLWAFEYTLQNGYDNLVTMDADLSHNPIEIQKLINESAYSNYVVGTRAAKKGGSNQSPMVRKLLSIGANKFCSILLFSSLSEYTTSFRIYDRKCLKIIIKNPPTVNDYSFFIQISFIVKQNNLSVSEVPIKFESRKFDKSKIPRSQIFLSIRTIIRLFIKKIKKKM